MKVSLNATPHATSSAASLRIRTAEPPADWQIAHRLLDDEHFLGAGREAGDRLCQFILEEDESLSPKTPAHCCAPRKSPMTAKPAAPAVPAARSTPTNSRPCVTPSCKCPTPAARKAAATH